MRNLIGLEINLQSAGQEPRRSIEEVFRHVQTRIWYAEGL